jgi:phycocyanobilin:ferredoxin oxidoreductase
MDAFPLMAGAAAGFRARLSAEPGCTDIPVPPVPTARNDLCWENTLLRATTFRRAHVETLNVPGRVSVLHVCVFPHYDDPAPVFGFDMVAGPARITGIFLDLSPVTARPPCPRLRDVVDPAALARFATRRAPPGWGDIFSADLLAIRPLDLGEARRAVALAETALDGLLTATRQPAAAVSAAAGQARYIAGQRRNEHTLRMLEGFIGEAPARRFIDTVLFPVDHAAAQPEFAAPGNQIFT